eukprot:GEMP01072816.1.p1 GENE.GEMP01072816.1~~GEMP01072816.1.p1  ORF type:complete len:176 (+),score=7.05 GEMP01072816.1:144-671(+)
MRLEKLWRHQCKTTIGPLGPQPTIVFCSRTRKLGSLPVRVKCAKETASKDLEDFLSPMVELIQVLNPKLGTKTMAARLSDSPNHKSSVTCRDFDECSQRFTYIITYLCSTTLPLQSSEDERRYNVAYVASCMTCTVADGNNLTDQERQRLATQVMHLRLAEKLLKEGLISEINYA